MLEKYAGLFSRLRTDRGHNRYPRITKHRAPHKPFLLLSVKDLLAQREGFSVRLFGFDRACHMM